VTITGTNFGSTQGSSTVKFNGTAATSITSWGSTSIVAKVPTGATTGNVVVTVSGASSNGVSFTVLATPTLTSLSPTSGAVGASVTITGTNFGSTQGTGGVKFNGTAATSITSWSSTSIVAVVPTGATTGNVVVTASGVGTNGVSFTVLATPTLTSLSPTSGAVGASVTITGTNFGSTQGTGGVKFNGTAASSITSWSSTSIVAAVPTGATTGNVVVTASGVSTNGVSFTVLLTPTLTSLSPTSGAVGASVTITGTNFGSTQGTGGVKFNGTAATSITNWSSTSIVAAVPTGATTGNVVVNASGVTTNGVSFTVLIAPTPTFSPVAGSYTSYQTVSISDSNPSATIYYAINGTPTTVYTNPIAVNSTETLEAIAEVPGYSNSPVASATYTIQAPAPTFSLSAGTYVGMQTLSISDANPSATIYYTMDGSTPTTSSSVYVGATGLDVTGTWKAIAVVTGYSNSSVASASYTIQAPPPTYYPAAGSYVGPQSVTLSSENGARIYYAINAAPIVNTNRYSSPITVNSSETIEAIATYSGQTNSTVSSAPYTITTVPVTPTFSLAPGAYPKTQFVSLSSSANATIYYTVTSGTAGTAPTTSSIAYTGGVISVGSTETIEAIGVVGGSSSAVATATYTLPAIAATTTVLSVSSAGSPVTTVVSGSLVNLIATVASGSAPVTNGTVKFCDATAMSCTDIHLLGTAQLTSAGTASVNLLPNIGSHSYKAIFIGGSSYATSSSGVTQLIATGTFPTTTTIVGGAGGTPGNYSLEVSVSGLGASSVGPTGTVSILDTNNANAVLGTGALTEAGPVLGFTNGYSTTYPETYQSGQDLVTVADFNGDGKPDIAIHSDFDIIVLLGNGNGTFTQASVNPIAGLIIAVAAGDFNGDGKPDLAVLTSFGSIITLLGNGDGTFAAGENLNSNCNGAVNLLAADFNRDGKLDLAEQCDLNGGPEANEVMIWLGNGDGTFTQASGGPVLNDGNAATAAVGDFNGDGIPDLAVTDLAGNGLLTNSLHILLGNGDGTFTEPSGPFQGGTYPYSIAVADFDGDGNLDVAVTNWDVGQVSILLGSPEGTLQQPISFNDGAGLYSITVGDFNEDGIPDIAVASNYGGTIDFNLGNGHGTFQSGGFANASLGPPVWYGQWNYNGPWAVAAGSFNVGAPPDLAWVSLGGFNNEFGSEQSTTSTLSILQTNLSENASAQVQGIAPEGLGLHNIEAAYGGDTNFLGSTSSTVPLQTVINAMIATFFPSEPSFGSPVTVYINLLSQSGAIPTGTVSCSGGGVTSASVAVSPNGSATTQMTGLPLGRDSIVCSFTSNNSGAFANAATSPVIVTVVEEPNTGAVTVTPSSATLYGGQVLQFSASVFNTSNQAVTWTISPPGAGTISATGLYTAPATVSSPQTISIIATSQAATGSLGAAMISLSPPRCASSGYSYQRAIVIDHTKIPNTDQSDFPFLFNTTDPTLKTTANGGHVSNSSGDDIIFSTDPGGLTKLDHELEEYNPATGQVVAWVRIPTLSHTTDTVLYMFYGNSSATTSQQNPAGVWDENHTAVYHLANVGAGIATDSTANGNNGTLAAVSAASGEIDGAAGLNGTSSYLQIPSADFPSYPVSGSTTTGYSASFGTWFKTSSAGVILGQTDGTLPGGTPGGSQPALYVDVDTGRLRASVFSHGGASDQIVTAAAYNDNNWHFAVDTYSNGTEELYVDGQIAGSQQVAEYGYNPTYAYFVGTGETANWPEGNNSWLYFNGTIDEVNVSNIARSSDWVQTEYSNQSSSSTFYTLYPENTEEVIPAAVSLSASQSQQFTVLGSAPGSCTAATAIWSMLSGLPGTLTASGLYTAPASIATQQTVAITGTILGDSTQSISTTVTLVPPVTVSLTPPSVTLTVGQSQQFAVSINNTANPAVIWTIDPPNAGSWSAPGLYTAPASVTTQQTVTVTATSQGDPSKTASVTITLVPPLPSSLSVAPLNATLYGGQTQQLTVTFTNTSNTAVNWTIDPAGVGTVSASGVYTAPTTITTEQTVAVTATSQADSTLSSSAMISLAPTPCASSGYAYQRTIVVDHSKVPNTDQANFPILFDTTDPAFMSVANGGHVSNANGYDIIFSTDPDGLTKLDHELEEYNPATGQIIAWVRIPTLSHMADTPLFVFYGNPNITAPQQNPVGVWDSNYQAVYHLANMGSGIATDSTANANTANASYGTVNNVSPASGEIDGAAAFDGSTSFVKVPSVAFPPNATSPPGPEYPISFGAWFQTTSGGVILGQTSTWGPWGSPFGYTPALYVDTSGMLRASMFYHGSVTQQVVTTSAYNDNNWHYAVDTYSNGNETLYVDGQLAGSQQGVSDVPNDDPNSYLLGAGDTNLWPAGNGGWFFFGGNLDEVRISNSARSSDWIATEFNNQNSPATFYSVSAENALEVVPATISLYAGQSQQFTATGICSASVAWSMPEGSLGTLTAGGLYTAPSPITTQQTVTITATAPGGSANSSILTLLPPVSVSVTPASSTLTEDHSQQFTAIVANSANQAVTWTVSPPGVGTITAGGVYLAPSTITAQQTVTITATSEEDSTKSASATITLATLQCVSDGYGSQATIVIDHTKVPNTDQTNFPFLFSSTDPTLKTIANGGQVTNSNGYDIIFSTDPGGLTKLDHELEEYNPATGQVIAWVRIPTLSHTTDTVLYVFYGNPNITSSQQNPAGVWTNNYQAVYHLGSTSSGTATDSTVFNNAAALTSVSPASGEIDGAASFNGSASFMALPAADFPNYPIGNYGDVGLPPNEVTSFAASFGVWFKTASSGGILTQVPSQSCWYVLGVCAGQQPTEPGYWDPAGWNAMLYVGDNGSLVGGGIITTNAYNDNNWHFAVLTYATNGTDTLYVDGQNVGSAQNQIPASYSPAYSYFVGTTYTFLAPDGNWNWLYFNGNLDEVTVTDAPVSSDWVKTEFNNQGSPATFYRYNPTNIVQVVPSAISLYPIESEQFAVSGICNAAVSWTIPSGAPGVLASTGLYTAPGSVSIQQTVTITASSLQNGTTIGSAVVTLLPAPPPIALLAAAQSPYTTGSSQTFTATVLDQYGTPRAGVVVTFTVVGANSIIGSGTTAGNGVASYSYTGANNGNDTVQATAVVGGQLLTSSSVSVSWVAPVPPSPAASVTLNGPPTLGLAGLVGAFTDNSGNVIEPIAIGAAPTTFVVPAGATQLQLGVDSEYFVPDGGPGFAVAVNGVSVPVPATAMPWTWVTGGQNNNYQYGILAPGIASGALDGTSPVVAATGLTQGETVNIAYQSGTASANYPLRPLVNANGDQTSITGQQPLQGTYFPTLYMNPSSYPLGQPINFDAVVTNASGSPMPNVPVTLTITGANAQQLQTTTNSTGIAAFTYTGVNSGADTLEVQAFPSGSPALTSSQSSVNWMGYATPPAPGSITLSVFPPANNFQAYTVLVTDASGNPIPNASVGFYVWGVDNFQLVGTTDVTGHAAFGYYHPDSGNYNVVAVATVARNVLFSTPFSRYWTPATSTNPCGNCTGVTVGVSAPSEVTLPGTLALNGTVTDNVGTSPAVTWSQFSGPGTITFSNQQQTITNGVFTELVTASFSQPGTYVLQLNASDSGNSASAQISITVNPAPFPAAATEQGWIISPLYGSAVSGVVPIKLATGMTLQSGTLSYSPGNNMYDVTPLPITADSNQIAQLDTTMLPNGSYWIQLQGTNTSGSIGYSLVLVTVVGNYKPGRVTAAVTDLVVPATGLSINIQRQYDSLNAATSGDFGYGWNLGINTNLTVDSAGNVTFTLGGQRRTFYLTPKMPPCTFAGCFFPYYFVAFTPEPGFYGSLTDSVQGCFADIVVPSGGGWDCQGGGQYSPPGYVYTDPTGTAYTISAGGALQSIQDRSGNGLSIGPNGITSTTGLNVPFVRDSSNRITQITDPQGNIYRYGYDGNGNLATVTYPTTSQPSTYKYDSNHLYLSGTDFRNNPLPASTYYTSTDVDPNGLPLNGRLESVQDALGEITRYAYNLATNTTTITYPPDASGNSGTATMVYDRMGDLLSSTDPLGHTTISTYDANHNLTSVTDPLGHTTGYTYDSNGNKTSQTYPATATSTNTTSTTFYNQYSEPTQTADELGNVRTFAYDANYNPQKETDSINGQTATIISSIYSTNGQLQALGAGVDISTNPSGAGTFTYDSNGNMTRATDPLGHTKSFTYDSLGHLLSATLPSNAGLATSPQVKNKTLGAMAGLRRADSQGAGSPVAGCGDVAPTGEPPSSYTITYVSVDGGPPSSTLDSLGRTTSYTYDSNGNTTSYTDPSHNTYTYAYDALNRLTQIGLPTQPKTYYTFSYDFRNHIVDSIDPAGNDTHNMFDAAGRLVSVTNGYGSSVATTTNYVYYNDGKVQSVTDALGNSTNYTYDAAGNLISVQRGTVAVNFAYDNARNRISQTDGKGNTTQFQYDARRRLQQITFADQSTNSISYNGLGNITNAIDQAGHSVQYNYDTANHLCSLVQANNPNTSSNTLNYSYDAIGNLTTWSDQNGHLTTQAFDQLNRAVLKTLPDGIRGESAAYDLNSNLTSLSKMKNNAVTSTANYTYDSINRLVTETPDPSFGEPTVNFTYTPDSLPATMTDGSGTTTYNYDALNRLTSKVTPEGTLTYTYDGVGNVASVISSNANGISVSYTYDNLNRLSTVTDNRLTGSNVTTYTYDPASNLATATYPNGLQAVFNYDQLNRLSQATTPISRYNYQRDPNGNLTSGVELNGRTVNWTYDGVDQLTNETVASAPSNVNGNVSYGLDPVGNRLSAVSSLSPISSTSATYTADDWALSESYDDNGDVVATGGKTFAYDSQSRLTSMNGGQVTLTYDGMGNRVSKTTGSVTTHYLVDDLSPTGYPQVVEEVVSGAVARRYTYGLARISQDQVIESVWTPSFYQYDGRGTVRMLTNAAGAVTDAYEYDAFGNLLDHTGTTPNNYLYRGEQWDPDLSLYYLSARYYNPATGRFMSQDPYGGDVRDPASLHRYRYASGNPVNRIDPSGRDDTTEIALGVSWTAIQGYAAIYALGKSINCIYESEASAVRVLNGPQTGAAFEQLLSLRLDEGTCAASAVFSGFALGGMAYGGLQSLLADTEPFALCCFAAGTMVHTDHGDVPIERIRIGDMVLSRNRTTGKQEYKRVTALTAQHRDKLIELRVEGETEPLRPSVNHPFWVLRAPSQQPAWIVADSMRVGDLVLDLKGEWHKVLSVKPLEGLQTVYNFEVEDNHDYFVGSEGLLVHNSIGCPRFRAYQKIFFEANPELEGQVQVHHAIEQQTLKNYPGLFTEQEIQALENLRGIPNDVADEIHQSLIRELWNNFYDEFPPGTATREDFILEREFIDQIVGYFFNPPVGGATD
jgi:RHS repeat-associated protein